MGDFKLRKYQQDASDAAIRAFNNYRAPFIVHIPTGGGKSYIISDILDRLNSNALVLQPSKEILEQNYAKIKLTGAIDIGIYSASMNSKTLGKFTYATIKSIKNLPEFFVHFGYVIIDECHVVNSEKVKTEYMQFLRFLKKYNKNVKVCGFTASPYRLVTKTKEGSEGYFPESETRVKVLTRMWGAFFKKIVYSISHKKLIDLGYLTPMSYHIDNRINLDNLKVNSTGSDFDLESMEVVWGESNINKATFITALIDKDVKSNLIFCVSIAHARLLNEKLQMMGLSSDYISSDMSNKYRSDKISRFRKGEVKHLLNVGIMTTGIDIPSIDCITGLRPTLSLSLYYQMTGRGSRLDPDDEFKVCKVIDLVGNVDRFGRIETIEMSKDGYKDIVISEKGLLSDIILTKML